MAIKNGLITLHIVDQYGIPGQTTVNVEIDDTKTVAQLVTDAQSLGSDVQPLTQGTLYKTTVTIIAFDETPTPGVGDIEKGALFNFDNATDAYATGILVPDLNPTILNASGLIDLTNTDVSNFVTFMTSAHTAITVVTKGVRALSALRDALITFRKHRKPLSRKTKESA